MSKARDIADSTKTLGVDGGTIKLDGNYPVGTQNLGMGDTALDSLDAAAYYNVAFGPRALTTQTTGNSNTAVGQDALRYNQTSSNNSAFGTNALGSNTTGSTNTALGRSALYSNTTASNNTAVGYQALYSNTTAEDNTAVGYEALKDVITGIDNTAVGKRALRDNIGSYNVAMGKNALVFNTSGEHNTALGTASLFSNTTASNNTAVGYQALYDNTTGDDMVAMGFQALFNNTTGQDNVGIGLQALALNTTGNYNVAMGLQALRSNTTASNNTAVGYQAGHSGTTAFNNAYFGIQAGYSATTGQQNTFIGRNSGYHITTGSKNTILGTYTGNGGGLDIRTSSNRIVLSDGDGNPRLYVDSGGMVRIGQSLSASKGGYLQVVRSSGGDQTNDNLAYFETSGNDWVQTINYNNGSSTKYFLQFKDRGTTVGSIRGSSSSTSYNTSSDHRLKENVAELTGATDRLKQLEPKRFNFTADADTTVDGFLAHEVQTVVPEAITGTHNEVDADGNPVYQGIDQSKLVPLLVATIKELEARITALENA